jgi:hypothetical protein
VILVTNEESRLSGDEFKKFGTCFRYHLCFVNDGKDKTLEVLQELKKEKKSISKRSKKRPASQSH